MIRSSIGDQTFWAKRTAFIQGAIQNRLAILNRESPNPAGQPQFAFDTARYQLILALRLYSSGAPIKEMKAPLLGCIDSWELSNRYASNLNSNLKPGKTWSHRHLLSAPQMTDGMSGTADPRTWTFSWRDLNHYNWCFWLLGLGLALEISDIDWNRLANLVGRDGEDPLLNQLVNRGIAKYSRVTTLLHPRPYGRLFKVINAPKDSQRVLLKRFVDSWFDELARPPSHELWWYTYGDPVSNPVEMSNFFGRWCIEAVAAVKAFGLDDSLCLGHEHYPGDLLRPDGPSTHPPRSEPTMSWWRRIVLGSRR